MALENKQTICIQCGDVVITDTTGFYDEENNPGGYGDPNPDFGETTPYTAEIFAPKSETPAFTLDLNLNPPEPTDEGFFVYTVTKQQLGFENEEDIPSGVWVTKVTFGEQIKKYSTLAQGDISRRIANCICCEGEKNIKFDYDLKTAIRLFNCFKTDKAQDIIDRLYKDTAACCGCNE